MLNNLNEDCIKEKDFWSNIISAYNINLDNLNNQSLNKIMTDASKGEANARNAIKLACEALSYSYAINEGQYSVRINLVHKLLSESYLDDDEEMKKLILDEQKIWEYIIFKYNISLNNLNDQCFDEIFLGAKNGDKIAKCGIRIACSEFALLNVTDEDESSVRDILKLILLEKLQ